MVLKVKDEIYEEKVFSHMGHQDPLYRQRKEFILQEGEAFQLKKIGLELVGWIALQSAWLSSINSQEIRWQVSTMCLSFWWLKIRNKKKKKKETIFAFGDKNCSSNVLSWWEGEPGQWAVMRKGTFLNQYWKKWWPLWFLHLKKWKAPKGGPYHPEALYTDEVDCPLKLLSSS